MSGSQQLILGVGAGGAAPTYIEDVFSTWLYTGNGSTQTITNGIDLSTKGGLVWVKVRNTSSGHRLVDTARGVGNSLVTNGTSASLSEPTGLTAFNSNGFSLGADSDFNANSLSQIYVSWTFRKQPKFFDVVTYTGNGAASRDIAHNLGATPGFIVVKCVSAASDWPISHRSVATYESLNTSGSFTSTTLYGHPQVSNSNSTTFRVVTGTSSASNVNANGENYVAYLFAHNAGGFGLAGTDNVISCGSYTGTGTTGNAQNIGYEPQWVLIRRTDASAVEWYLFDNMRGMPVGGEDAELYVNSSSSEVLGINYIDPNATGFSFIGGNLNSSGANYIYIAIRRGPMKTPTSGTSVFAPVYQAGGGTVTTNFVVDASITKDVAVAAVGDNFVWDRLRGSANGSSRARNLITNSTAAESAGSFTAAAMNVSNTAVTDSFFGSGYNVIYWNFRRAPGFFDVVCYTGTGVNRTVNHNLGVVPELMIVKVRNSAIYGWAVYSATLANTEYLRLDDNGAKRTSTTFWNSTTPTATVFSLGTSADTNGSGSTFVAYLFASCPGVSKVGSYTGTGALQTINCGFTSGARFVLIKRTDTAGNWWVYDSARGITSGNDPYLFLNDVVAEVAGTNYVDTTSVGFQVTAAAPTGLNASGGTYLFLAIA